MTLTFAIRVIYCSRPASHLNSSVLASSKHEVEKMAITLTINDSFYPKLNLTIFYDYTPVYKI